MIDKPSLNKPFALLATWFGCGYMTPAPGTWGSVGAIPFGVAIYYFSGFYGLLAAIGLVIAVGTWAAAEFDKASGTHDSEMIVIDEVAGQWIAMLATGLSPLLIFLSLLLFRFFDITKIFPANWLEKNVPGGAGVMADDLAAGIYALIGVILLRHAGIY